MLHVARGKVKAIHELANANTRLFSLDSEHADTQLYSLQSQYALTPSSTVCSLSTH